jgi:hypothetical protein
VYEITGEQGLLQEKGRYAVGQGPMWVYQGNTFPTEPVRSDQKNLAHARFFLLPPDGSVSVITGEQGLLQEKGRYAVGQGPMWVVVNAH